MIVHSASDLAFAEAMATAAQLARAHQARVGSGPELLLQPGWQSPVGQNLAIDFVRQHPHWRLSLQSHKWLGVR